MNGFFRAGTGAAVSVIAAILVPVSIALAGYQEGGYDGTTEQMETLAFRAGDGKVKRMATTVYAECADSTRQRITVERGRTEISDDRFSLDLDGSSDLKVTIFGRFRAERATGRIEASVKPPGTACRADVHWQAALVKQP
jgi:hypothetical protein